MTPNQRILIEIGAMALSLLIWAAGCWVLMWLALG